MHSIGERFLTEFIEIRVISGVSVGVLIRVCVSCTFLLGSAHLEGLLVVMERGVVVFVDGLAKVRRGRLPV